MQKLNYLLCLCGCLLLIGCSVLNPQPPRATIAPPPNTQNTDAININDLNPSSSSAPAARPSFEETSLFSGEIAPELDSDIVALMDSVSEQQLIAYVQALENFGTRNSFSNSDENADQGIGAARKWIFQEFNRVGNGRLITNFQPFTLNFRGLSAAQKNVVAVLPGVSTQPNAEGYPTSGHRGVVVIGAHYDSRIGEDSTDGETLSPSADDNATGVALLLEMARLLSSRRWNQTIVFVAFSSEEQGTIGSRTYVSKSITQGVKVDWMISNDGVGGRKGIPWSARLYAPNMGSGASGKTARYVEFLNKLYMPDFPLVVINALDRKGRYGDHREFINAGIGGIRLIQSEENEDLLNSQNDTWEKIDYTYLAQVVRVNLVAVANWAGSPAPSEPPAVAPMAEEGSYLVTWKADPFARGYAVSFRPLNQITNPDFRYVAADQAGRLVAVGLDPNLTYSVSVAPISLTGRLGGFSEESLVVPAR